MKADTGTYLKDQIKTLRITKPNQKIRFQVRHPENATSLVGIAVNCNAFAYRELDLIKGKTAGHLSLMIVQQGDVAYGEDVSIDNNTYQDITERRCWFERNKTLGKAGKRLSYFETNYPITHAIMEGYYEDVLLGSFSLDASGAIITIDLPRPSPLFLQANEIYLPVIEPVNSPTIQPYTVNIYFKYQLKK